MAQPINRLNYKRLMLNTKPKKLLLSTFYVAFEFPRPSHTIIHRAYLLIFKEVLVAECRSATVAIKKKEMLLN